MDTVVFAPFPTLSHERMEAAASVSRIARALAAEPQFIVLRRAVSALDVSIRRQILNLLQDIQEQRGLSYI